MAGNSFGNLFRLTTFGESHGKAIGGVIDGCPGNVQLNLAEIQAGLDRRKPGQSKITTQRKESDIVEFLSGINNDGKTLGTPIGFLIQNQDQKSKDYGNLAELYRPSHADFTYEKKFGIREHRGGGRSSARETACRVVAGEIAKQILENSGIKIKAYVSQVGGIKLSKAPSEIDFSMTEESIVRCPDKEVSAKMEELILAIRKEGDTVGGVVTCFIENPVIGLGEPVFDRLNAELAKAMFSINAVKGFELGSGFAAARMKGSEHNDSFIQEGDKVSTQSNYSGGIQGGISNGQPIYFDVAFKPVATILQKQTTISQKGEAIDYQAEGRHDPCVVPRAVPIVEAMAALVMIDYLMIQKVNA